MPQSPFLAVGLCACPGDWAPGQLERESNPQWVRVAPPPCRSQVGTGSRRGASALGHGGGNWAAQCCLPSRHSMPALNRPFIHTLQASYTLHGTARDGTGRVIPILLLVHGHSHHDAGPAASTGCACPTQGWLPRGVRAGPSPSSLHAQEHDPPTQEPLGSALATDKTAHAALWQQRPSRSQRSFCLPPEKPLCPGMTRAGCTPTAVPQSAHIHWPSPTAGRLISDISAGWLEVPFPALPRLSQEGAPRVSAAVQSPRFSPLPALGPEALKLLCRTDAE